MDNPCMRGPAVLLCPLNVHVIRRVGGSTCLVARPVWAHVGHATQTARAPTLHFRQVRALIPFVAGAGFEPATSGL